jgi:hypothetical protein
VTTLEVQALILPLKQVSSIACVINLLCPGLEATSSAMEPSGVHPLHPNSNSHYLAILVQLDEIAWFLESSVSVTN